MSSIRISYGIVQGEQNLSDIEARRADIIIERNE